MIPFKTATGEYTIGFRRGGSAWQKSAAELARWAADNRFGFVDLAKHEASTDLAAFSGAGLLAGQVDLLDWHGYQAMIAPDSAERRAIIEATAAHIQAAAAAGTTLFFAVTIPADKQRPRRENFDLLVESYAALLPALERAGARVAIEGWPGPGAVCCTPETFRAFFREIGSDGFGINYDPSHLLRMGIDPLRFLHEFTDRVYHVHAKDTAITSENFYEFGYELPPTFATTPAWGGATWRYTIPGQGRTNWAETFRVLKAAGYRGFVSIELEDENYNGAQSGEQRGLLESRDFLAAC